MKVKFSEVLRQLLVSSDISQKELARLIKTSEASISNYIHGKEQPTLKRLIAIASYFDVSLDYLVFGQPGSVHSEMEFELHHTASDISHRLEVKLDRQTRLISRISTVMFSEMKKVINQSDLDSNSATSNLITEEEYWQIEQCSLSTKCHSPILHDDFVIDPVSGECRAGPYLHYVIENLRKGPEYHIRYLYSSSAIGEGRKDDLLEVVRAVYPKVGERVTFREIAYPMQGYFGFHKIDTIRMKNRFPVLHTMLEDWIFNGWLGAAYSPTFLAQGSLLMDEFYLRLGLDTFDQLWEMGK